MTDIVLVTGATDGIGFETARALHQKNSRVLVHGRNQQRAIKAVKKLSRSTANDQLIPVWGDFSRMSEVRTLAAQIAEHADTLDVLVNNAGIYSKSRHMTSEGLEQTMAVNYFAPYVLTNALLPLLQQSNHARVINVSSMTHESAELDLNDLDLVADWDAYLAYAISKLCNILFTKALHQRYGNQRFTTNALHPGVVGTKLLKEAFQMDGLSHADGAKTSVYLATDPKAARISGEYFNDCRVAQASRSANNQKLADELWEASKQRLEIIDE